MLIFQFLCALSVAAGLVTFVMDARGKSLTSLPKYWLGSGLMVLAIGLVILQHIEPAKPAPAVISTSSVAQGGSDNVNMSGSNTSGTVISRSQNEGASPAAPIALPSKGQEGAMGGEVGNNKISQSGIGNINISGSKLSNTTIRIDNGDSIEAKLKKLNAVKGYVSDIIVGDLISLDARIAYVQIAAHAAYEAPAFNKTIESIDRRMVPAASSELSHGTENSLRIQRVTELRSKIDSEPLTLDIGSLAYADLRQPVEGSTPVDVTRVSNFFSSLPEVTQSTSELYNLLESDSADSENAAQSDLERRHINLQCVSIYLASESAYLSGLRALNALGANSEDANKKLSIVVSLMPNRMIGDETAVRLLKKVLTEHMQLVNRKSMLLPELEKEEANSINDLGSVDNTLIVKPGDTWEQVVGKARSLREFGRVRDAIGAFAQYGDMFKDKDPTALQYSRTAIAFTENIHELRVSGGCYVFEVGKNSPEVEAGLQVGDIIIRLDGKPVPNMYAMTEIYSRARTNRVPVVLLRLNGNTGRFESKTTQLRISTYLQGVMPI